MPGEDWLKDETGAIILYPLVSSEVLLFRGSNICVRLLLADRTLELGSNLLTSQVTMTPDQADALADDLRAAAARARTPPQPGEGRH